MLIDTSGFLSLYERKEPHHQKALDLYDSVELRITTNYVIAEYTALAQVRGIPRNQIIEFSSGILNDEEIEIIWIDRDIHAMAAELIGKRSDKNYPLCNIPRLDVVSKACR